MQQTNLKLKILSPWTDLQQNSLPTHKKTLQHQKKCCWHLNLMMRASVCHLQEVIEHHRGLKKNEIQMMDRSFYRETEQNKCIHLFFLLPVLLLLYVYKSDLHVGRKYCIQQMVSKCGKAALTRILIWNHVESQEGCCKGRSKSAFH